MREVPVELTYIFIAGDKTSHPLISRHVITPDNLNCLVDNAVLAHPQNIRSYCVISGSEKPSDFTMREHFLPEGLGFKWASFPKGVGTCDSVNSTFSKYELQWQRLGALGLWRPFFVSKGKKAPPKYLAKPFETTSDKDGRFIMNIYDESIRKPLEGRDEGMVLEFNSIQPNATAVALAVHKAAFLILWLTAPPITFDSRFSTLRQFFLKPSASTYRPFSEQLLTGSAPGAEVRYFIEMKKIAGKCSEDKTTYGLSRVSCGLTVHGMLYFMTLCGDFPSLLESDAMTYRVFEPLDLKKDIITRINIVPNKDEESSQEDDN
jgi:hypothetical protein